MPFAMATNRRGPQRLCIRTCSISPGGLSSRGHFVSTRPYRTEQTLQLLDARCRGTPPCFFSSLFRGTAPVPCFPEHPPHTPSTCLSTQRLPFHEAKCWPPRERATWGVGRSHHGPGPSAQPLRRDSVAPQGWSQRSRSRVSVTSSSCSDRWMVLPCLPHCPASSPDRLETVPPGASAPGVHGQPPSGLQNSSYCSKKSTVTIVEWSAARAAPETMRCGARKVHRSRYVFIPLFFLAVKISFRWGTPVWATVRCPESRLLSSIDATRWYLMR